MADKVFAVEPGKENKENEKKTEKLGRPPGGKDKKNKANREACKEERLPPDTNMCPGLSHREVLYSGMGTRSRIEVMIRSLCMPRTRASEERSKRWRKTGGAISLMSPGLT